MSTQALLDKIAATTAKSISLIEAETASAVATIEESAATEIAKINTDALAAAEKSAAAVERATLAKARQAGKLLVQTARRRAFDGVMTAAEQALMASNPNNVQAFADKRPALEMYLLKQLG